MNKQIKQFIAVSCLATCLALTDSMQAGPNKATMQNFLDKITALCVSVDTTCSNETTKLKLKIAVGSTLGGAAAISLGRALASPTTNLYKAFESFYQKLASNNAAMLSEAKKSSLTIDTLVDAMYKELPLAPALKQALKNHLQVELSPGDASILHKFLISDIYAKQVRPHIVTILTKGLGVEPYEKLFAQWKEVVKAGKALA